MLVGKWQIEEVCMHNLVGTRRKKKKEEKGGKHSLKGDSNGTREKKHAPFFFSLFRKNINQNHSKISNKKIKERKKNNPPSSTIPSPAKRKI